MTVSSLKDELYQTIHDLYAKSFDGNEDLIQESIENLIKVLRSELPLCACSVGGINGINESERLVDNREK